MPGGRVERVRSIETAAADALPCRVRMDDDGWRLRYSVGDSRRCNSVLAEHSGEDALPAKIARVEAFYAARGAPARFQISEASLPHALPGTLRRAGYRRAPGALVESAELSALLAAADAHGRVGTVRHGRAPTAAWLAALERGSGHGRRAVAQRTAQLSRVVAPATFVELVLSGGVVAVGFAAVTGPWLGVFNLATRPEARRRGAATRLLGAIATWGRAQGARQAYLQVHPANAGARALYASLGFATHHTYVYWESPALGPAV